MPLDPAIPPAGAGRIILPGGADPAAEHRRILLPPGVAAEPEEELPEHPRLRPLEIHPVRQGEREMLLVTDPLGVLPQPVALRAEALDLLQFLDGTVSLAEMSALVAQGSKDIRAGQFVREFVAQLDRLLLLESPRFEAAFAVVREAYHQLEIRPAALAGAAYPAEPAAADAFVADHYEAAGRMEPVLPRTSTPRALLVPHLDPRRAGPSIARGYMELDPADAAAAARPLRVIVYGVGHSLWGEPFALTRKHFETPCGRMRCDTPFVDAVARQVGDLAWRGEIAHRDEHSIEFQALFLMQRFPKRALTLVPILCAGFHALIAHGLGPRDSDELEGLIGAIRATEADQGGDTVHVAAVDFSHVGARFGDPAPDERVRGEIEARDREALEAARRGDADAWHAAIAAHEDSTRICGWGATYTMLRCAAPGEGRLLHYEPTLEDDSLVSMATLVWP